MKKVFDFISGLKPTFYSQFGYPTIKVYSDYAEVYFDSCNTLRDVSMLQIPADEFKMFPNKECITYVFTFYFNDEDEKD